MPFTAIAPDPRGLLSGLVEASLMGSLTPNAQSVGGTVWEIVQLSGP